MKDSGSGNEHEGSSLRETHQSSFSPHLPSSFPSKQPICQSCILFSPLFLVSLGPLSALCVGSFEQPVDTPLYRLLPSLPFYLKSRLMHMSRRLSRSLHCEKRTGRLEEEKGECVNSGDQCAGPQWDFAIGQKVNGNGRANNLLNVARNDSNLHHQPERVLCPRPVYRASHLRHVAAADNANPRRQDLDVASQHRKKDLRSECRKGSKTCFERKEWKENTTRT